MLKFNNKIPLYLQIKEEIEEAIIKGTLKADESIPSIRKMAQEYRLNPQTISYAINLLMQEGSLYKKRGIGMFVKKNAKKKLTEKKVDEFINKELKQIVKKSQSLKISKAKLISILKKYFEKKGE